MKISEITNLFSIKVVPKFVANLLPLLYAFLSLFIHDSLFVHISGQTYRSLS